MTTERILNLAWRSQLEIWAKEKEILEHNPLDAIAILRERKAWKELKEIEQTSRLLTGKANEYDEIH